MLIINRDMGLLQNKALGLGVSLRVGIGINIAAIQGPLGKLLRQ